MSGPLSLVFCGERNAVSKARSRFVTDFYGPELVRTSGPLLRDIPGLKEMPAGIGETYFLHGITPQTSNSTHYFCFQTRNYKIDDEEFGRELGELDKVIRQQDCDAINNIEPWVDRGSAVQRELVARADRPSFVVRDKVRGMIAAEEQQ